MKTSQRAKTFGYSLIIIGVLLIILNLFSDVIRGRNFYFGFSQVILLVIGVLSILFGYSLTRPHIKDYLRILWKFVSNSQDIVYIFLFALYATLFFLGKWEGLSPFSDFWGDSSAIAGFAAAYDHPKNFITDALLSDPSRYLPYKYFVIPYLSIVHKAVGDYSLALLTMLPLAMFLQLTGFYLLGKKIYKNRLFGLILALLSAVNIQYGAWDYWGFFVDPQPRFLFQSLIPYVLLLFFEFENKPKFWPLVMLAASLAGYVHLLSGPALALMIWLGFFINKPLNYTWKKFFTIQGINALVYVLSLIPIVNIFLSFSNTKPGTNEVNLIHSQSNIDQLFARLSEVGNTYLNTLTDYWFVVLLIISLCCVFLVNRQEKRKFITILVWLVAVIFVCFGLPFLIQIFENNDKLLISTDLIRNIRYTFPLLYLIILFGVKSLLDWVHTKTSWIKISLYGLLLVILVLWSINAARIYLHSPYYFGDKAITELACFKEGRLFCPTSTEQDAEEILNAIQDKTSIGDRILAVPGYRLSEQIRYGGLRTSSLVASDRLRLPSVSEELLGYYNEYENLAKYDKDKAKQLSGFITFACKLDSDYLLADWSIPTEIIEESDRVEITEVTGRYKLVRIMDCKNE